MKGLKKMSDRELIMEIFKRLDDNFDDLDDPTLAITDSAIAADALEETLYNVGLDNMYTKDRKVDEQGYELWYFKVIDPDQEIENIWDEFEDIPMDEDSNGELVLAHDWRQFKAGTTRTEIWKWFDETHSKGINWLLYEREDK